MKALTLWQPWASLIADLRKPIETRPRPWYYNGYVAIHAGLHVDRAACLQFGYDPDTIPRGAVVAVARKYGCLTFPHPCAPPDAYGDFTAGRYGYLLQQVHKLDQPIPAKGRQGFWNWPIDSLPLVCTTCWDTHLPYDHT
jgi:hypothetical protein